MRIEVCFLAALILGSVNAAAQKDAPLGTDVDIDSPTFVPTVKVGKVFDRGDSILYMQMINVYV